MRKLMYSITIIGTSILLIQCTAKKAVSSATPKPEAVLSIAQKRWPSITQQDLDNGKDIYATKCTKCHGAKDIAKRSEEDWQKAIDDMAPKARLTEVEKETLTHYLFAAREAGVK